MDDRAPVTAVLQTARRLRDGAGPAGDVFLVFTTNEEIGGLGCSYVEFLSDPRSDRRDS